jgi:hypothetical protein
MSNKGFIYFSIGLLITLVLVFIVLYSIGNLCPYTEDVSSCFPYNLPTPIKILLPISILFISIILILAIVYIKIMPSDPNQLLDSVYSQGEAQ